MKRFVFLALALCSTLFSIEKVQLGVDVFFNGPYKTYLKGKKVGLVSNHTGVNKDFVSTFDLLKKHAKTYEVKALFSPEHGWTGSAYAFENVPDSQRKKIAIYSLHGKTRRPTQAMLKDIDLLIFDIQDVGVRAYTYISTLFYVMEEAAKRGIEVVVLDRPNPITGVTIDGSGMEKKYRSFIGYIDVPYCHGMTVGELARFFNKEYKVGCKLHVIKMKGWKRTMTYADTGLAWIPTSPHIPEKDTPLYYATTGMLGELEMVNIGVGYTLPFKIVGAPWIHAEEYAKTLNEQGLEGISFIPFHFKPFYGRFKGKNCQGVLLRITDAKCYRPQKTLCVLMGLLKSLYPDKVKQEMKKLPPGKKTLFCKASGSEKMLTLMKKEPFPSWKMAEFQTTGTGEFLKKREPYLLY